MEQDSTMADAPISSPAPQSNEATASPAPIATTPTPRQMDPTSTSATNTNANSSATTNGKPIMPKTAAHHGAPTRDWINTHVTGVLLEGMKLLAAERPDAPLHALGTYLIKRSAEIEGKAAPGGMEER